MKSQRLICTDIRRIELAEFELPRVPDHGILVQNDYTAVSVGTEIYSYAHGGEPSSARNFPRSPATATQAWCSKSAKTCRR